MKETQNIRRMTLVALMAALTFVLTLVPRIPTPIGGYVHLGDVIITFSALAFGPWIGAVVGGLGTALADLYGGYVQFALASLLVHGLQGWAVGWIGRRGENTLALTAAVVAGAAIVVAGYFVAEIFLMGIADALLELLPNALQGLVGGIVGVPLYLAVKRAYPPLIFSHRAS
ncbi:MAG: ECF transporter S component [Anaerolineae bacterium]